VVRAGCDANSCRVQCGEDEMLLTDSHRTDGDLPQSGAGQQSHHCGMRKDAAAVAD